MCVILQIELFECVVKRMEQIYIDTAKMLRAMSDPKRLRIVDMLSCGELCACKIQEEFHITQPTLSHDMKVLTDAELVVSRREGKRTMYSLNWTTLKRMNKIMENLIAQCDSQCCK